jgi:hypothetical protein
MRINVSNRREDDVSIVEVGTLVPVYHNLHDSKSLCEMVEDDVGTG